MLFRYPSFVSPTGAPAYPVPCDEAFHSGRKPLLKLLLDRSAEVSSRRLDSEEVAALVRIVPSPNKQVGIALGVPSNKAEQQKKQAAEVAHRE
jgi:hypothetical protein